MKKISAAATWRVAVEQCIARHRGNLAKVSLELGVPLETVQAIEKAMLNGDSEDD